MMKPLCVDNILKRGKKSGERVAILLADGEDPYQTNRDCRLHHYEWDDIATCFDRLSHRRAKHKQPVHIAFIGESILRHQYMNFLKVINFLLFLSI